MTKPGVDSRHERLHDPEGMREQKIDSAVAIASIFFTVALGTLAGALARVPKMDLTLALYAAFFFTFRLKMFLDDIKYFRQSERDKWFRFGYIIGMISWFFWLLAAISIHDIRRSILFTVAAMIISTAWVLAEWIRTRFSYREHLTWLSINLIYIISGIFALFPGKIRLWLLFSIWLATAIIDSLFSKSWEEI